MPHDVYQHPPGSSEAKADGCRCPVMDNGSHKGVRNNGRAYVINIDCPLHAELASLMLAEDKNENG